MKYGIAFPKYSNRPKVGEVNQLPATVTWVVDLRIGLFDTCKQAKAQFMHSMGEAPDVTSERGIENAVANFDAASRNLKCWKVVKYENP